MHSEPRKEKVQAVERPSPDTAKAKNVSMQKSSEEAIVGSPLSPPAASKIQQKEYVFQIEQIYVLDALPFQTQRAKINDKRLKKKETTPDGLGSSTQET